MKKKYECRKIGYRFAKIEYNCTDVRPYICKKNKRAFKKRRLLQKNENDKSKDE
jgi:hypothetical protein